MLLRKRNILAGTILVGAAFRFHALFYNSFSSDEALYAYWARMIATWRDTLLSGQPVDKPPLLFYIQAIFYPIFGTVEWAARMPDFIASILLIPLTGVLAWRLFKDQWIAIFAAGLVALSPLAIRYTGSAYTDPLLTFFLTASLLAVIGRKGGEARHRVSAGNSLVAGLLFGLAVGTKYQAWLFLPLILGLGFISRWNRRTWLRWSVGFLVILLALVAWELGRSGDFTLVNRQLASYGGVRIAWSWELWPRFKSWVDIWTYAIAPPVLYITLLLGGAWLLWILIINKNNRQLHFRLLMAFTFGYFFLHWLLAIPTWERYLLPLIPITAILISVILFRGLTSILNNLLSQRPTTGKYIRLATLVFLGIQLLAAVNLYSDIEKRTDEFLAGNEALEVAEYFRDAPYGTVLYDHWYSWKWRYYLFDTKVYISWFSSPDALIEDLIVFKSRQNPNYIVLPNDTEAIPVVRGLKAAGFSLLQVSPILDHQPGRTMILYQIDSIPIESS